MSPRQLESLLRTIKVLCQERDILDGENCVMRQMDDYNNTTIHRLQKQLAAASGDVQERLPVVKIETRLDADMDVVRTVAMCGCGASTVSDEYELHEKMRKAGYVVRRVR
jgi:hypothetical protein